MVIVMLSHGYPPTISGVTLVVQKLARHLVRRGHRVVVLTASDRGAPYRDTDQGVELIRVRGLRNLGWSEAPIPFIRAREFRAIIDEIGPDLIHTHENTVLNAQLLRLKKKLSVPVVSSCYYLPDYVRHYLPFSDFLSGKVESLLWKWSAWNLNHFDFVVFSTPTHYERFVQHGVTVPAGPISNGVDVNRYYPLDGRVPPEELARSLPPRPRILFVSRLAKDKKISVLIQAMAHLKPDRPAHLLLAGRGDDRPRLERLVKQLDLEDSVHFLGFVPEPLMPDLYRAADLFAIASICEVQSIPSLQAAATGLPIVAARAGALPELVHEGRNGFLVQPNDPQAMSQAIRRIVSDEALARRMGQASLAIGRQHSEATTFQTFESLYQSLLDGPRPAPELQPAQS